MFFGASAKITNITDLETELKNLNFPFYGDTVQIGPVTFDFSNNWADTFVQDISAVFRLELDRVLGKPDLPNDMHSINKIFVNFEDVADEILILATTVYIIKNCLNNGPVITSKGYNYQNAPVVNSAPPMQGTLPLNYGNSKNPQASLTSAPAKGSGLKQTKNVAYSPSSGWQPVATTQDPETLPQTPMKKADPVCDCGASKANTTHADWCSLKQ